VERGAGAPHLRMAAASRGASSRASAGTRARLPAASAMATLLSPPPLSPTSREILGFEMGVGWGSDGPVCTFVRAQLRRPAADISLVTTKGRPGSTST
jgi:hypothetical protein